MIDDEGFDLSLDEIIEDFPFRRQSDQKEKLAQYIVAVPGASKTEIQEQTGISQPTIREIQNQYQGLDQNEKIFLIMELAQIIKKKD